MPRDYSIYLCDMLEAARKIRRYVGERGKQALDDEKTLDAVARNLEVIGEAAKRIPDAIRHKHPEIPWARLAGLRDILIHQYFGIDLDILWDIVQNKVPDLEQKLVQISKPP